MIAENIKHLRERIVAKCLEFKRNPQEIRLIAVSKFFGVYAISEANRLGITDFGENKAQELRDKYEILGDNVTWHFIGTLQRNKVKYAVKAASFIHSVDSSMLADEINNHAQKLNKVQKILLEVKTSFEETKSGLSNYTEVLELVNHCSTLSNIELVGLMTMAPFTDDESIIRKSFSDLRKLKDEINKNGFDLSELSMGMTNDYEIAIEEGATMLRIGSAIFGHRNNIKDWRQS
ncbi:MAG: YggS family pyridoxal phosphate enzyme [Ignavibacteria bacterium RBG_16_36_9]|jgi:pyridoxal phosphate enzyme (YggS family)|nr:MAG: YggS family pyridoxal phosphate enzyme [Ignavibacteria bacterium RBG_16_36_9]